MNVFDYLSENEYPGRGIIVGHNGTAIVIAYFIMGRSENSRNRVFRKTEYGLRTLPFDESKCVDPSLIIYSPVRELGGNIIVSNGDQTDTVYDQMTIGGTFEAALHKRVFEPDRPNFTPRISALVNKNGYKLSILKSDDGFGEDCLRAFFDYSYSNEIGHIIHTYESDGDPLPSFKGEPRRLEIPIMGINDFAEKLFDSLNAENRISLYTRFIHNVGSRQEIRIINRWQPNDL